MLKPEFVPNQENKKNIFEKKKNLKQLPFIVEI